MNTNTPFSSLVSTWGLRVLGALAVLVVGRIVDQAGGKLDIIVEPFTGQRQQVAVADVESRVASPVSPMPAGLLGALTLEEVLDLLAYLESGGNRSHPAFR